MSRYARQIEGCEVVVGWDHPLQTFFGIIRDPEQPPDEQVTHWVGADPRALPEIEDLERAMPYGARRFVTKMSLKLYGDRDDGR